MRTKQVLDFLPLPAKAKLVWERFTFSALTVTYVVFSLLHFLIQVSLQIRTFTINAEAGALLFSIATQGNAINNSLPALEDGQIRMCASLPGDLSTDGCVVVWKPNNTTPASNAADPLVAAVSTAPVLPSSTLSASSSTVTSSSVFSVASSQPSSVVPSASATPTNNPVTVVVVTEVVPAPIATPAAALVPGLTSLITHGSLAKRDNYKLQAKVFALDSEKVQVNITGMGHQDRSLVLNKSCMWSLNWPISMLHNTKREDIVFIAFQFWVLGMSMVALLNESIPHILASLLTHMLGTAWSGFQITQTASFREKFDHYITHGACADTPPLLPTYWQARAAAEIPILSLNAAALLVSCFLTWKLVNLFGWQTFKRVGASLTIKHVYQLVLVLSIALQLSVFFMGVTVGLFLDQLFGGWIGHQAIYQLLYKVMFIATAVMLIPFLTLGWFSVRRELRFGMVVFLGLCLLYLVGWGVMFISTTFRWTFITWQFFGIMSTASVFLTLICFILGVICRYNFGKGLIRYLNAQEPLPGDDFQPRGDDLEKVAFPSTEKPVPTYTDTFGSGSEVPFRPSPQLGPRFFNSSADPFESPTNSYSGSPIPAPMAALTRSSTKDSTGSTNRRGSFGSLNSHLDSDSNLSRQNSASKRWVIDED